MNHPGPDRNGAGTDPAERLAALEAEQARLAAAVTRARERTADWTRELRALIERQREVADDTRAAAAALAAIRAGNTWRLLEWYWGVRLKVRGNEMRTRGLVARARARRGAASAPRAVGEAPLGVNVAGYLSTESGMGEAARASIRSLEAAGVTVALNNVDSFLRTEDRSYTEFVRDNPHPFNLVHLNADNMAPFAARRGRRYFKNHYTIGYWFWELSTFREDWMSAFTYVDEVWVASEFTRACLRPHSGIPIVAMPLPVVVPDPLPYGRSHFGLADRAVVFLYMFDVSSQTERKNPLGVIRAFRRAGLPRDRATLVLKFTNAEYDRHAVRRLHEEAEGLNVLMLDGYMERRELATLMAHADCYLSLHRAEGFGLTIAEAMRLGKPVIATRYSGNVDFMADEDSYLVDYRLVPLTRDYGPYLRGSVWAEPDVEQAAAFIRAVVEHPDAARAVGQLAQQHIADTRSPAATGRVVRQRLESIRETAR